MNSPTIKILETRIVPITCDEDHPELGVYHPDGHEDVLVLVRKRELDDLLKKLEWDQ